MKRIAFATLGCKSNYVDTEEMISRCRRLGMAIVSFDDIADAYVINTCTVTSVADQQSRQLLRRPRKLNPNAIVIATGCTGQVDPASLGAMHEIDAVFGTADRSSAVAFLQDRLGIPHDLSAADPEKGHLSDGLSQGAAVWIDGEQQSRARAFFKIQDGCDHRCTYCIVPTARGAARSLSPDAVERACLALSRHHREVVLTGVDIGQYGRDLSPPLDLFSLLARLVQHPDMPRIRLSSIAPTVIDARMLDLFSSPPKICRHLHLSLQSGTDEVLRAMGRSYGTAEIERAMMSLIDAVPHIAVTGDVIAGFPGETEAQHDAAMAFFTRLPIAGLHVFPYSVREGTIAASLPHQVAPLLRRKRAAAIRTIATSARARFLQGMVGVVGEAIVTSRVPDREGRVLAFTDNAISVSLPAGRVPYGEMGRMRITEVAQLKAKGLWE